MIIVVVKGFVDVVRKCIFWFKRGKNYEKEY